MTVLMLPGFGGTAEQPILLALERALAARDISVRRAALARGRPSPGLLREVEQIRALLEEDPSIAAYAGRSFGGRVLARLALELRPRALVLLGFPVRSAAGRRRRDDEETLGLLDCPTLIVQGQHDPLGPVRTLARIAARNPCIELGVIPGATHAFGRRQRDAITLAADWLAGRLG
jgi:predicted alpha/beta-hydrolase family hydrolase